MSDSLVIIPTYNEKENIANIIEVVFALPEVFHILIVDDGSPDGTADIVKRLISTHPQKLFILERKGKLGLGTAYIAGFRWGLERSYEYIFEMDADFSHNPNDLLRLKKSCSVDQADLAVGSRYIKGGKLENWPLDRIMLSYGASLYVKLITFMMVNDPTAGFVCYTRKVLETIDLSKIKFIGYAFQIEMKFKAHLHQFKIIEVPIIFKDRLRGKSKMSSKIISEAVFGILSLKWQSIFNKNNL